MDNQLSLMNPNFHSNSNLGTPPITPHDMLFPPQHGNYLTAHANHATNLVYPSHQINLANLGFRSKWPSNQVNSKNIATLKARVSNLQNSTHEIGGPSLALPQNQVEIQRSLTF